MSHRMYLYNLNHVPAIVRETRQDVIPLAAYGQTSANVTMMMEWGYELPLFFYPLFTDAITIAAPVYNGAEGGLYALSANGIKAFRDLYDFITQHQAVLVDQPAAFLEAKDALLQYFDRKIKHSYFHLDAWDVFNMSDDDHAQQAAVLKESMEANNALIRRAIAANDPALLDQCPFLGETGWAKTFKEYLNHEVYDYGWAVIRSSIFESEPEVFEENGYKGLKDEDGEVVLPAEYDEIYDYPSGENRAVITRQGKSGYIDRKGQLVIPCIYDDAFDFLGGYGHIVTGGKFGVIDEDGKSIVPAVYEDGYLLGKGLFAVTNNREWAVIGPSGDVLIPFQPATGIDAVEADKTYYQLEKPDGEKIFFTHQLKPLPANAADTITVTGDCYIITRGDTTALVDGAGNILFPFAVQQFRWLFELEAFVVSINDAEGLYLPGAGWLLEPQYSGIVPLPSAEPGDHGERYALVHQQRQIGLFAICEKSYWVLPVKYFYIAVLRKAARQGSKALELHAAGIEAMDNGDYTTAIQNLEQAGQLHCFEAITDLGYLYETVEAHRDVGKAFSLYLQAAQLGEKFGMNNTGLAYLAGRGVTADYQQAAYWLGRAVEKYHPGAIESLADMYYYPEYGMEDLDKALALYIDAFDYRLDVGEKIAHLYEIKGDSEKAAKYKSRS